MNKDYARFFNGCSNAYEFLGCHELEQDNYKFSVWAPTAKEVYLCGDFNRWKKRKMTNHEGIWTVTYKAKPNDNYKFFIVAANGRSFYKADPYAFKSQTRGMTNSLVEPKSRFIWSDAEYLKNKSAPYKKPLNIYEIHLGSWRRKPNGDYYTYTEFANELIPYVKKMGYTHIELLPITEYPLDDSWGYQATGYFSPTTRYGAPDELRFFVDCCHKNDIGVILDWVPAHFCKDEFGLIEFDGSCCYESADTFRQEHASWGTRNFDFGRREVQSFLLSSAVFWLKEFHFDGLRVDAVASMLYLDYDRREGQWRPNSYGGKENLEAIEFFRKLSTAVFGYDNNVLLIAEESTAFGGVTLPADCNGLGFNYKWNMGWMNDLLRYISTPFYERKYKHNVLTFSMVYAYSENYILPFSHDEVVHLKASMIEKMPGNYEQKFNGLRALMTYMMAHPGKKLNFMGNEFAQFVEWRFYTGLDWVLLDYPSHRAFQQYISDLNHIYLKYSQLYELDHDGKGFAWLQVADESGVIAFERVNGKGEILVAVVNFSDYERRNYNFNAPNGKYRLIINSDDAKYCGSATCLDSSFEVKNGKVNLTIPPLSAQLYSLKLSKKK